MANAFGAWPDGAVEWRVFECNCEACWWLTAGWPALAIPGADDREPVDEPAYQPAELAPRRQATLEEVATGG